MAQVKVTESWLSYREFGHSTAEGLPCRGADARLICRGLHVLPLTDHQIGTSARAPQRPMVTYTGMCTERRMQQQQMESPHLSREHPAVEERDVTKNTHTREVSAKVMTRVKKSLQGGSEEREGLGYYRLRML
ncbi:hypothetical protein TNCV_545691 [Trichonephila clavipes]|nr:hypothetical protein TNCV_545691 [Trichonephila clavipes]